MQKLLAKCRRLVGHFKHSALATNGLEEKQKALGFKPTKHIDNMAMCGAMGAAWWEVIGYTVF